MKTLFALISIALIVADVFWTNAVRADDASVASTPTGDLVFLKNDSIEMLSEDLTIGVNKVQVDYVFRNNSSADITMRIGFPLPVLSVGADDPEFQWRRPHDQEFKAWVDGKPVAADTNIRVGRLDFTSGTGDPQNGKWIDITKEFDELDQDPLNADVVLPDTMKKLHAMGLICGTSENMPDAEAPCWEIKKTYTWDMTFPAHRTVTIRHEYKPWKGSFPDVTSEANRYCPDQSFRSALAQLQKKERQEEAEVGFILKTATNWAGPIKSFTLRIDKEGASLVSYCPIKGLELVRSGNTFVGTIKNYVPDRDILIYFVGPGVSVTTEYDKELHRSAQGSEQPEQSH
jgi:hypothetical protein